MKQVICFWFLMVFSLSALIAEPTDREIQQAANTLGVPYADLRQFVQSYHTNTLSEDVIMIDTFSLHQAYQSNRIRADNLYKGKTLRITGVVYKVEQNCVNLQGPGIYVGWVSVFFRITELPKIANLETGQTVTFVGICDGGGGYIERIQDAILLTN
jgi:hypothetical protein